MARLEDYSRFALTLCGSAKADRTVQPLVECNLLFSSGVRIARGIKKALQNCRAFHCMARLEDYSRSALTLCGSAKADRAVQPLVERNLLFSSGVRIARGIKKALQKLQSFSLYGAPGGLFALRAHPVRVS